MKKDVRADVRRERESVRRWLQAPPMPLYRNTTFGVHARGSRLERAAGNSVIKDKERRIFDPQIRWNREDHFTLLLGWGVLFYVHVAFQPPKTAGKQAEHLHAWDPPVMNPIIF